MMYPLRFLVWLDRVVNVLLNGSFSETLSSRAWRMYVIRQTYWGWTSRAIDMLFFWQPDHCRVQFERERVNPLPPFQVDKLLHFLAGVAIAAAAYPFGIGVATITVFVIAIGKELRDSMGYGTPDAWDAAATIGGGFSLLAWFEFSGRYL